MNTLINIKPIDTLPDLLSRASNTISRSRSVATKQAYTYDWCSFESFAADQNRAPLPAEPDLLVAYFQFLHQNGRAASSISRAAIAISRAHRLLGLPNPTQWPQVKELLGGIRRAQAGRKKKQARPISFNQINRLLKKILDEDTYSSARDACLLALGWYGALRRSELVDLNLNDITDDADGQGLICSIKKSKTDQEGNGALVTIPFATTDPCPVKIFRNWMTYTHIAHRPCDLSDVNLPLFCSIRKGETLTGERLSTRGVAFLLKKRLSEVGYDPDLYSAHSLRAGFATAAAAAGADERKIAEHLRHRSIASTRGYIRIGQSFSGDHPLRKLYALQGQNTESPPTLV